MSKQSDIYFIEDNPCALLEQAYKVISDFSKVNIFRIAATDVFTHFNKDSRKKTIIIFSEFNGPAFEHCRQLGMRIMGPQVILHYVREEKPLPKWPVPLYSTALRNAVVTVSSITDSNERQKIYDSVQMLNGTPMKDLTKEVNVVITSKVGSKKYLVACSYGIHPLLPSWLDEAWKLSAIQDPLDLLHSVYTERFRVPVFTDMVIAVTGLSLEERNKVRELVEERGGRYSPDLKAGECSHLVANSASGQKYESARKWRMQIVSIDWLIGSVEQRYALDEAKFPIIGLETSGKPTKASTPTSSMGCGSGGCPDVSTISCSRINETLMSNEEITFVASGAKCMSECRVAVFGGADVKTLEKWRKMVESVGGRFFASLKDIVSEEITHVLVVRGNQLGLDRESGVSYVLPEWLEACHSQSKRVAESDFLCSTERETEVDATITETEEVPSGGGISQDEINMIHQYFERCDTEDFAAGSTSSGAQSGSSDGGVFHNCLFLLYRDLSENISNEMAEVVVTHGGKLASSECKTATHEICSFTVNQPARANLQRVTYAWVHSCVESCSRLPINKDPTFQPVLVKGKPLEGCTLSISGYSGRQRSYLIEYAKQLGGIVQEFFFKKAAPEKGLLASTHLLSYNREGRKFQASQKWQVPAVSREWVFASAALGRRAPEEEYPVPSDVSKVDMTNMTMDTTAVPTSDVTKENIPIDATGASYLTEDCEVSIQLGRGEGSTTANVTRESENEVTSNNIVDAAKDNSMPPPAQVDTPKLRNPRVHQLRTVIKPAVVSLNTTTASPGRLSEDVDTPSKFLAPGVVFEPRFDIGNLQELLKTPEWANSNQNAGGGAGRRTETPLTEIVDRGLRNALEVTSRAPRLKLDTSMEHITSGPLSGVVICVSKKISSMQLTLNSQVEKLGGSFKWTYDNKVCTHLIYEATHTEDKSEELTRALADKRHCVHPSWVTECLRQNQRLSEEDFPPHLMALFTTCTPMDNISMRDVTQDDDQDKPETSAVHANNRTSSSSIGDVSRRLETMLTVTGQASNHTKRKRRRTATRGSSIDGDSVTDEREERSPRDIDPTSANQILAQPSQSLQVRWQYDDAVGATSSYDQTRPTTTISTVDSMEPPSVCPVTSTPTNSRGRGSVALGRTSLSPSHQTTSTVLHQQKTSSSKAMGPPAAHYAKNMPQAATETHTTISDCSKTSSDADDNRHNFLFSGVTPTERDHYAEIVRRLGGTVEEALAVKDSVTHLITRTPARSEKFMACLASGKWILHKSYLEACGKEGRWVPEEGYEWGGPGTEPMLAGIEGAGGGGQNRELARAARKWRIAGGRGFGGWKVVFAPGCAKEASFRRLVEAGGGQVIPSIPNFPPPRDISHAFVDSRRVPNSEPLPPGFQWLKVEYMASCLTAKNPPELDDFVFTDSVVSFVNMPPIAAALSTSSSSSNNRPSLSRAGATRASKRIKLQ